jgi:hypothetical protein
MRDKEMRICKTGMTPDLGRRGNKGQDLGWSEGVGVPTTKPERALRAGVVLVGIIPHEKIRVIVLPK